MKIKEVNQKISLAKIASEKLLCLSKYQRKNILFKISKVILDKSKEIIIENNKDVLEAKKIKNSSFIERLSLNQEKIRKISKSIKNIAYAEDILFSKISNAKRPSGIKISKIIFPLGLIAMIYESRPNVTIDAFALSFKSGNSIILKGGKEARHSITFLIKMIRNILQKEGLDPEIVQNLAGINSKQTQKVLKNKKIDCLIPRGGKNLIDFVLKNSNIPLIITGASVVHIYIDKGSDLNLVKKVVLNAKTRRVSICNALDVILIHKKVYKKFVSLIIKNLSEKKVEIRADIKSYNYLKINDYSFLKKIRKKDFDTEFLDYILSIKIVNNLEEAINHIKMHSSGHSEAIITKSKKNAQKFFRQIDAGCLYLNTSTQFSDGEEFGMDGEIGISTQKLHARGPFSYRELTTYKYIIESQGSIRK